MSADSPAFGQADLSNCERELIHLAGSIQPHGALLVLRGEALQLAAASANAQALLGLPVSAALGLPLAERHGALARVVQGALATAEQAGGGEPVPLRWAPDDAPAWEGALHIAPGGERVLELEPAPLPGIETVLHERETLLRLVSAGVQRIGQAASLGVLADATARCVRDLIGHDRVMVYKFDADGHGEIIAEASDPRLESLLGHHYPASDIPQRARELYLRNRVRVLVDAHYEPAPLIGADGQPLGEALDMSMCYLRSMSPLHLQYLKNMGVTATVVVSLVHEGRLWGLIAAHHYAPRNIGHALRAACDLLGEVVSTRIAAIENYAHAQVAVLVRRLEQRLVEATSTEGDWRLALFRNPRTLLQPLEATGAALFDDGEVLTAGETPSTPELRELHRWLAAQTEGDMLYSTSSVGKVQPLLDTLTPTASGVLAVRLSSARPDMLIWFRKEQLRTVTWAGDPHKPMLGDDPLTLSPRRSFAAWSELVRGTAVPWTQADLVLGRAFGMALVDIIVQVHAVRLLVAEHQLATIRATVRHANEPILIADAQGGLLFCNAACKALLGGAVARVERLEELPGLFSEAAPMRAALQALAQGQSHWRGELSLRRDGGEPLPVAVRLESVPGRDGKPMGVVARLFDLSQNKRAAQARRHLEDSLQRAMQVSVQAVAGAPREADPLLGAILTNTSLAAMDIAEGSPAAPMAPLLEELENSSRRATALVGRIRDFTPPGAG